MPLSLPQISATEGGLAAEKIVTVMLPVSINVKSGSL